MAYSIDITKNAWKGIDGRVHLAWTIAQTDVTNEEWVLDVPPFFEVTLFEAVVDSGTIDPELGLTPGWPAGGLDEVATNDGATAKVRNQDLLRVTAPEEKLYGRSNPSGSLVAITTRITLTEGH